MTFRHAMLMAFIFSITSTSVNADVFRTVTTGRTLPWSESDTWIGGIVPPDSLRAGDSVIVNTEVVLMTSLGNHGGHIIVNGSLLVYGDGQAVVLSNQGSMEIYGNLNLFLIDYAVGTVSTGNTLVNGLAGTVDLYGSINVVGGEVLNEHVIDVYPGGAVHGYGYVVNEVGGIVRTADGSIYNLEVIAMSSSAADPVVSGVSDPVNINYSSFTWNCLPGHIMNYGTINLMGGAIDQDDCSGGNFSGNDAVDPLSTCGRPQNLTHEGDLAGGLKLSWDPVPAAGLYFVGLKLAGAPNYQRRLTVDAPDHEVVFPAGYFPTGINVEWAVLPVCSGALDLDNLAVSSDILSRYGTVSTIDGQAISMFPNPARDVIYIEPAKPVKNGVVEIYDMSGRMVVREAFSTETPAEWHAVSTSTISDGIYVVKVIDGQVVEKDRFRIAR